MESEHATDTGIDMNAAVDQLGSDLFGVLPAEPADTDAPETDEAEANAEDTSATESDPTDEATPVSSTQEDEAQAWRWKYAAPPKSWERDFHEVWNTISPRAQNYIAKREQQMTDSVEQYRGETAFGASMKEIFDANRDQLQHHGIDEAQALHYLFAANRALLQGGPEQRLKAYQDLGTRLGLSSAPTPQTPVDPHMDALEIGRAHV
jgi:hypothetical protein